MPFELDDNVVELLADRLLHKQAPNEWAIKCLERGFDSKNLRILASMLPVDAPYEVDERQRKAMEELGWDKIQTYFFMIQWARTIAKGIVSGQRHPIDGSRELFQILQIVDAHWELGAWYSIDEALWSRANFQQTGKTDYSYLPDEELRHLVKAECEEFLLKTNSNFGELPGTTFEQAEALFRNFLKENGMRTNLRWLFYEDVLPEDWNFAIKSPLPPDNRHRIEKCFELGKRRNLGLAFFVFCTLNGEPCCYIQVPEDDTDAQYQLMGNNHIKFSFRIEMPEARAIQSPLLWTIKKLFPPKGGSVYVHEEMPTRETLLPIGFKSM